MNKTQENDKNIPGFIKYKIINLVEKRNRKWTESLTDKNLKIKSKQEVSDEYHSELKEKTEVVASSKKSANYEEVIL